MDKMISVIISLILGALLIFVLVSNAFGAFNPVKDFLSNFISKSNYSALEESVRNQQERNFDILTNNLKLCRNIAKQNCICHDVIVNFPYTFIDDITIRITHKRDSEVISMVYGKQQIKNTTLDNTFISSASFVDGNIIETIKSSYESEITFAKGIVSFDNDKVILPLIYKRSQTRLEIPIYNTGSIFKPGNQENQIAQIESLPKC
jgi:hypothetical protein